jgi:hypothetical protein
MLDPKDWRFCCLGVLANSRGALEDYSQADRPEDAISVPADTLFYSRTPGSMEGEALPLALQNFVAHLNDGVSMPSTPREPLKFNFEQIAAVIFAMAHSSGFNEAFTGSEEPYGGLGDLTPAEVNEWVRVLRSGDYQQGTGQLARRIPNDTNEAGASAPSEEGAANAG